MSAEHAPEVILTFDAPAAPLSMNDGDGWDVRDRVASWRNRSHWAWIEAHPGVGPSGRAAPCPAEVRVTLPFGARRRRDPINFARTVKHIVDGLVLAGAWPDDTEDYVTQHIPTLVVGELGVTVRVSPREERHEEL